MKSLLILSMFFVVTACSGIQYIEVYNGYASQGVHSRGLAINDSILYISGAKGKITIFNVNSKKVTDSFSVPWDDIRGVNYLNDESLLLMNSGDDGIIYKYNLKNKVADARLFDPGAFFDALIINKFGHGFVMGDPMHGQFKMYRTLDFGQNWEAIDSNFLPTPSPSEAGFAASNTGIVQFGDMVSFVTGASSKARLIKSMNNGSDWIAIDTPMKSGGSFGIYSTSFWSETEGVIAGGSYVEKGYVDSIAFMTNNGGETWSNISLGLPGYVSCIQSSKNVKLLVATGRLGVYYSINKGKTWQALTNQPFYTVIIKGSQIILSGQNGTLAIYQEK